MHFRFHFISIYSYIYALVCMFYHTYSYLYVYHTCCKLTHFIILATLLYTCILAFPCILLSPTLNTPHYCIVSWSCLMLPAYSSSSSTGCPLRGLRSFTDSHSFVFVLLPHHAPDWLPVHRLHHTNSLFVFVYVPSPTCTAHTL